MHYFVLTLTHHTARTLKQKFAEQFPGSAGQVFFTEDVTELGEKIATCTDTPVVFMGRESSSKSWTMNIPKFLKDQHLNAQVIWASMHPMSIGRSTAVSIYLPHDMKAEQAIEALLRHADPAALLEEWKAKYATPP